jgi:hypothetical protein
MPSQSDTLALAASVVDNFSRPLADLTRQLKAFSSTQEVANVRGKRVVDDHWKSYRELALQSRYTADNVKKLLTPAISELGLASIGTLGSLAGITAAVKGFSESAKNLGFLSTETGLAVNQLKFLEELAPRLGIGVGQMDAAVIKFAQAMDQLKKHRGTFIEAFGGQASPELLRFIREDLPKAKNNFEALQMVMKEIQSGAVNDVEKRMLAEKFGLPPEFARATKEKLEETQIRHFARPWAPRPHGAWWWRSWRKGQWP